jgi:hypothetical protein
MRIEAFKLINLKLSILQIYIERKSKFWINYIQDKLLLNM